MLLGILSDTHGDVDAASGAVELLRGQGAEFLLHCGDVGDIEVLDLLPPGKSAFVLGNCDFDGQTLRGYAEMIGVQCCNRFGDLTLGGKRVALLHGDDPVRMRMATKSGDYHYLFFGHTHIASDHREGPTRLVNPGALYRVKRRSVALLDTQSDTLRTIYID